MQTVAALEPKFRARFNAYFSRRFGYPVRLWLCPSGYFVTVILTNVTIRARISDAKSVDVLESTEKFLAALSRKMGNQLLDGAGI